MEKDEKYYLDKFKPYIKGIIKKYRNVRYFSEDDIISYSNMGIINAIDKLDETKNPNAYIIASINNYIYLGIRECANFINLKSNTFNTKDQYKKLNNIISLDSYPIGSGNTEDMTLADVLPSSVVGPAEETSNNELVGVLLDQIGSLPEDEKEIIEKRFFENKTLQAIAKDTGFTKEWIRVKINAVCDRLKDRLLAKIR